MQSNWNSFSLLLTGQVISPIWRATWQLLIELNTAIPVLR